MVLAKKVCVVGAGVSGLASARELRREGHAVTVMEQSGGVGGQWLYDPGADAGDPLGLAGVHSGIYASLRLVVPREAMSFSDFPFYPRDGGDARRYPGHAEFLRYVRDFCGKFGLMDAVRLNTRVLRAAQHHHGRRRLAVGGEVVHAARRRRRCCGHRGGVRRRRRRRRHVRSSKAPNNQRNGQVEKTAAALPLVPRPRLLPRRGGSDRRLQAERQGHRAGPRHGGQGGAHQRQVRRRRRRRRAQDGVPAPQHPPPPPDRPADAVVYCTGYDYSFPFLDTGGLVTVDDNRVGPLFEHTFPPALAPSLSFVGVPKKVVVPLFYEAQARWVAQVLSGRRTLPPVEEMLRSVVEYNRAREMADVPKRYTHDLFDFEYCDDFGEKHCGFPRMPEWKKELMWSSLHNSRDDHEMFRDNYHDSDLVLEGLRSQGWLPFPSRTRQDDNGDDVSKA